MTERKLYEVSFVKTQSIVYTIDCDSTEEAIVIAKYLERHTHIDSRAPEESSVYSIDPHVFDAVTQFKTCIKKE